MTREEREQARGFLARAEKAERERDEAQRELDGANAIIHDLQRDEDVVQAPSTGEIAAAIIGWAFDAVANFTVGALRLVTRSWSLRTTRSPREETKP